MNLGWLMSVDDFEYIEWLCDGDYQVRTNVSQYEILQDTRSALGGSQMPLVSSSVLAFDARSMGTNSTIVAGSHSAKKTGTSK